MITLTHFGEGLRIYKAVNKRKREGFYQYSGDADSICGAIIKKAGIFFKDLQKSY